MVSKVYSDARATATVTPKPRPLLPQPEVKRPSIALALGGGAARGFAHIGVMRTLVAHGIVPDIIVGTSIGAVVGGCYAAGQLDGLEAWSRSLTVRGVLGYLDLSLSGSGLIRGGHLASRLEEALHDTTIENLPLRFAAIATEFNTGHEVWLTRGRLVDALRASYALPGIFPPAHIGGRWLVDGALVNPVPVSAARALDARLVIAVNLNSDLFGRGTIIANHGSDDGDAAAAEPPKTNGLARHVRRRALAAPADSSARRGSPGIPTVMVEAFNVMQDRITRARLAGDPPDVLISPRLGARRLVRFSSRRASRSQHRRRGDRKGHRRHHRGGRRAVAALRRQRHAK